METRLGLQVLRLGLCGGQHGLLKSSSLGGCSTHFLHLSPAPLLSPPVEHFCSGGLGGCYSRRVTFHRYMGPREKSVAPVVVATGHPYTTISANKVSNNGPVQSPSPLLGSSSSIRKQSTPSTPPSTAETPSPSDPPPKEAPSSRPQTDEVSLSFEQGLPQLTVPLPSRRELCRFTLRPVTHTVKHLIQQLQEEDKGIDRLLVRTKDGVRIASSASIESLLLSDFQLVINDVIYPVCVPEQQKSTLEEVSDLNDVRQLVNKLYAALNIDEHQLNKEREIIQEIEDIKHKLIPLDKHRSKLAQAAERRSTILMYSGLGYMALQFGFLARLTWWEYSWDIMEPVTYFVTYGTAIACYAYYVLTKHDFILPEVRDRQWLLGFHRKARKTGLDVSHYNRLKDRLFVLESDLQRLRDPLSLNLPQKHLAKLMEEQASLGTSKSSPLNALQTQLKSMLGLKK